MAYDAFCLSKFMVDRALNKFPVYFVNFGGGQSILYGYVTAIFIKLYGFNLISIRITAVIFNSNFGLFFYDTKTYRTKICISSFTAFNNKSLEYNVI